MRMALATRQLPRVGSKLATSSGVAWRWRSLLLVAVAWASALVMAAPAAADYPPVHVTFKGSGTWHEDAGPDAGGRQSYDANLKLNWDVSFTAQVNPDGTLAPAPGVQSGSIGTWTYTGGGGNISCSGLLTSPFSSVHVSSTLLGKGAQEIKVEAIPALLDADTEACFASNGDPAAWDNERGNARGRVIADLAMSLPDAMTAVIAQSADLFTAPLAGDEFQQDVSDVNAVNGVSPGSCPGICELQWSGTLTFRPAKAPAKKKRHRKKRRR